MVAILLIIAFERVKFDELIEMKFPVISELVPVK